ncbi:hypothetical protein NP493_333g02056 [Ridgeia piscesae]|uniref:Solute carrier family 23 member 2 n=1 Tax=Ridgeia piscesae TaxID=27915 RepID=A0AAD9L4E6_RIDPI|nr:hypothetical protein NP493_333g02056 [Ridgeia piscesae]
MVYDVNDMAPWYLNIIFAFQHYISMFGSTLSVPLILAPSLCIPQDSLAFGELISTFFFVGGVATLLQTILGSRLPVIQGASFAFMTPAFAILSLPQWKCPSADGGSSGNITDPFLNGSQYDESDTTEIWQSRIREIQGAIVVASCVEVLVGVVGGMGFLLRYIGPLTIAPTISLVGLPLAPVAASFCAKHWWIATMTMVLIMLFSQYLRGARLPCISYSSGKGFRVKSSPFFHLYAVILAIVISWTVCALLTLYDVLPAEPTAWGHLARTDVKMDRLTKASWFRVPYPCQWGLPTVSTAAVCGMLAGVFAAMIETIGSLYAAAKMSSLPPPPVHAINRGILAQGVGCVLAGLWGTGSGTAVYSENIAVIGITNVASRRVMQTTGVLLIIFATVGKIGGFFATIPDPVIGGVFMIMFGMITAVGILNLQMIDLNIPRNLFITGFSLFLGLSVPQWVSQNPKAIDTGVYTLDQVLLVFCSTGMLVGGVTAFFLDNTIPGTEEERGLKLWKENLQRSTSVNQAEASSYDLPFGMALIRKCRWAHRVPFSPTYGLGQSGKDTVKRAEEQDDFVAEQLDVQTVIDGTLVSEKGNVNIACNDFNSDSVTKM